MERLRSLFATAFSSIQICYDITLRLYQAKKPFVMSNPELLASTPTDSPHISGDQPGVLRDIVNPGVNLCLWQRPSQAAIVEELFALPALALPDVRCTTSLKSFDTDVNALLQQQDLDPSAFENWRIDLRRVAEHYFSI
ncbi:MAG: DUF1826 domain-containing protein, partial [Candidatus Thiodiazotropha taylori]